MIPTGESVAAHVGRTNNTIVKQKKRAKGQTIQMSNKIKSKRTNNHLQHITPKTKE